MQNPPQHVPISEFHWPQIFNCIDGQDGHFGIARKRPDGRFEHLEEDGTWTPALKGEPEITGHIFHDFNSALSRLQSL